MTYSLQTSPGTTALAFPDTKVVPGQYWGDFPGTLAPVEPWANPGSGPNLPQPCSHYSLLSGADTEPLSPIQLVFSQMNHYFFPPAMAFWETWLLWSWPPLMVGLVKAIITKVWMTDLFATFQGVFVNSNTPGSDEMDSGEGCYGLEGVLSSFAIPENSSPQNWPVSLITTISFPSSVRFARKCHTTPDWVTCIEVPGRRQCWPDTWPHWKPRRHSPALFFFKNARIFLWCSSAAVFYSQAPSTCLYASHSTNPEWVKSWISKNATPSKLGT